MIAVITVTRIHYIAHKGLALQIASVVRITDVYQLLGIAMETMIVSMVVTNHPVIVNPKVELVSGTCSLVTMVIAFLGYTYAMETMIAWTIPMKTNDTNVVSIYSLCHA